MLRIICSRNECYQYINCQQEKLEDTEGVIKRHKTTDNENDKSEVTKRQSMMPRKHFTEY